MNDFTDAIYFQFLEVLFDQQETITKGILITQTRNNGAGDKDKKKKTVKQEIRIPTIQKENQIHHSRCRINI